jgi:hypothetical protein
MAQEHARQLTAAREKLVAERRQLAETLAKPHERGQADVRAHFVAIQETIEAIDRALQDEQPQPTKGPVVTGPRLVPTRR